jgi:hypothetical protein
MGSFWSDVNPFDSSGSILSAPKDLIHGVTDTLGMTHDPSVTPGQGADTAQQKAFRDQLMAQYTANQGKVAPTVTGSNVNATPLDQTQANQARAAGMANLGGLQGIASGATKTAADSLLTQGTDQAAKNAAGLAAAYSARNPGAALRQGLAASNNAYAQAASQAGIQKAQEQAAARGQIGQFAGAMQGQDLGAAEANQRNNFQSQQLNQANALQAQGMNQGANLQQQSVNNQFQLGLAGATGNAINAPVASDLGQSAQVNQVNQANGAVTGQVIGAVASGGASALANGATGSPGSGATTLQAPQGPDDIYRLTSDARAKKNIKPVSSSLADAYGENVHAVTYQYKPGEGDGGAHTGLTAQDVEKVDPNIVSEDARGVKGIDIRHLSASNTGVIAELARRIRALEEGRAA